MVYKVAVDTELANTKLLLLGEIQGQVPESFSSQLFHQLKHHLHYTDMFANFLVKQASLLVTIFLYNK